MKSIKETIEAKVISYLTQYSVPRNSRLLIAWSGGPDSTALLSIMSSLKEYNFHVSAAWYDHRLRAESELHEEEKFVKTHAGNAGIKLHIGRSEYGAIETAAAQNSQSIEEAARNARYSFLMDVLNLETADYLVLGHNRDDNSETMLMRFFQNAGISGLSGIPPRRGVIIRPFGNVSRKEIETYIEEVNLGFSVDTTNLEHDFLRNRIRHEIVPVIKNVFPNIDDNLSQLSSKFALYNDFIDSESEKRIVWSQDKNRWMIKADDFYKEHLLLRISSVFRILNNLKIDTRIKYSAVENAVSGVFPGNGKILLRTAVFEILTAKGYIFAQRLVNHNKKSYFIYLESESFERFAGQSVSVKSITEDDNSDLKSAGNHIRLSLDGRMIIRSYREGDCITSEYGCKSIKKLFNEWKVSEEDRYRLPVIEDSGQILAVIGRHLGYGSLISAENNCGSGKKKILLIFNSDTE